MAMPSGQFHIQNNRGKRIAVTVGSVILLSLLYVLIWMFSAQDGAASTGISTRVSLWLSSLFYGSGGIPSGDFLPEATQMEGPLRKVAHFLEYACTGVLLFGVWKPWKEIGKRSFLFSFLWIAFTAAVDELHQYFVPGRNSALKDVVIDTSGGITGLFLIVLLYLGIKKIKGR